jgi:hypothetical protein
MPGKESGSAMLVRSGSIESVPSHPATGVAMLPAKRRLPRWHEVTFHASATSRCQPAARAGTQPDGND